MFERFKADFASKMRSFLRIYPSMGNGINIQELLDFDTNVAVNKIWFRGDAYELSQLYKQLDDGKFTFWDSVPSSGLEIRKIHTGLPKTIVNMLSGLIVDDLQGVKFKSEADNSLWKEIDADNDFCDVVKRAVAKTLYTGDGAFKVSIDTNISNYPILEFYEADKIDVIRERGRVKEIIFKTPYEHNNAHYTLKEHYGKGYIHYELLNSANVSVTMASIPRTEHLTDIMWDGDFALAEYVSFYSSDKFEGRGQSIFDAKRDNFDALDEAWSQWMDALRAGRSKTYIPENLIPRDENGKLMRANSFDNRFIKMASVYSENDNGRFVDKIDTEQPAIPHESYLSTYVTALDLCLQGIISPSTLGIDVKKLDNAEAQREKEKATLYTRQTVVAVLQRVLPNLVRDIFYAYQTLNLLPLEEIEPDVAFGEYANPSFESQVETVGKAKTQGVMSIDAAVDELYGDSKDDEWKKEEVARIKAEQGIVDLEEPAINVDNVDNYANNVDNLGNLGNLGE